MREIVLVVHNIRSCHNVGSLLRTADGIGVKKVYLTGYTPYPGAPEDERLPHMSRKITAQIHKTALGAEDTVHWSHDENIARVIRELRADGFSIVGLEQDERSIPLPGFHPKSKTALVVGREVDGIEHEVLERCDTIVEIPMSGQKESFNVAVAAAIGLFFIAFSSEQ